MLNLKYQLMNILRRVTTRKSGEREIWSSGSPGTSTVLIVYESNTLLILGYTFTSKFNTSRFSYSYLVRVLHTKAHITQGNKNMYQKKITCCSKQAEPKLRRHWVLHLASQSVFFSASDFSDFSGFSSSVSV